MRLLRSLRNRHGLMKLLNASSLGEREERQATPHSPALLMQMCLQFHERSTCCWRGCCCGIGRSCCCFSCGTMRCTHAGEARRKIWQQPHENLLQVPARAAGASGRAFAAAVAAQRIPGPIGSGVVAGSYVGAAGAAGALTAALHMAAAAAAAAAAGCMCCEHCTVCSCTLIRKSAFCSHAWSTKVVGTCLLLTDCCGCREGVCKDAMAFELKDRTRLSHCF